MALGLFHVDESGGVDRGSFVMGGYSATVATWERFSDEWQAALNKPPKIPPLHMVECEGLRNGFEVLDDGSPEQRLRYKKLHALVSIIRRHTIVARVVRWRSSDFNSNVRGKMPRRMRRLNTPHAFGFITLLTQFARENPYLAKLGSNAVEIIFDWHEESGLRAQAEYEKVIRPELEKSYPQFKAIGVHWPRPAERWKYPALQAADMLVWHVRRAMDYPDGKKRPIYKELMSATRFSNRLITATQMRDAIAAGYK